MLPTDRVEFVRVLNGLAAIRRVDLTPEAIHLWWTAMSRWSLEDFRTGASHLVSSCQFMPSPYDFEQLRRAQQPAASEAWAQVLSSCTQWRNPSQLPNGRISRAVAALGGYRAIAMADIERDLPHFARRFKEAYEELSDVEETREALQDFGLRKLSSELSPEATLDEALRPVLLEDSGSESRNGSSGFKPVL